MTSQSRYLRYIQKSTPVARKEIYKLRQKEIKEKAVEAYQRPERIKKRLAKYVDKVLSSKVTSKSILKKEPRGTYVVDTGRHPSSFQKEYQREKNLLAWN